MEKDSLTWSKENAVIPSHTSYPLLFFNRAVPGLLGSRIHFKKKFSDPVEHGQRHTATKRELATGRKAMVKLARKMSGWFLRRTKALISDQLPKKEDRVRVPAHFKYYASEYLSFFLCVCVCFLFRCACITVWFPFGLMNFRRIQSLGKNAHAVVCFVHVITMIACWNGVNQAWKRSARLLTSDLHICFMCMFVRMCANPMQCM